MTIRFTVCPYCVPHPAAYERGMVVDDFTRQFKCAACDTSGTLLPSGQFPMPVKPAHKNSGDEPLAKEASNA